MGSRLARDMGKLTETKIRNLKDGDGYVSDGGGLYINAQRHGLRAWYFRFRSKNTNKNTWYCFGEWCKSPTDETPDEKEIRNSAKRYTLAEARSAVTVVRDVAKAGLNPKDYFSAIDAERADSLRYTFEMVADEWQKANINAGKWSLSYQRQIQSTLKNDVYPLIGKRSFSELDSKPLRELVVKKSATAPTMANNIRIWFRALFDWAAANGFFDETKRNPAELLRNTIVLPERKSHQPISASHIKSLSEWLTVAKIEPKTHRAILLMLYTMVRPSIAATAHWSDIDLDGRMWRVKGERVGNKKGVTYTVPLSDQVVELYREMGMIYGDSGYVFPHRSKSGLHMGRHTPYTAMVRGGWTADADSSPHAFRTTAMTMMLEAGVTSFEVLDRALGHSVRDKVRAAYDNAQYMDERKRVMQIWADHVDQMMAFGAKAKLTNHAHSEV